MMRWVPYFDALVWESDHLRMAADSFQQQEGVSEKGMLVVARLVFREVVAIASAATVRPFLLTVRVPFVVVGHMLVVTRPVSKKPMATWGSIVTFIEVTLILLLIVIVSSVTRRTFFWTFPSVLKPFKVTRLPTGKAFSEVAS